MCGIAGVYSFSQDSPKKEVLRIFTRMLTHRGPDQQTVFARGRIGFAHTRLKIIDLSDAASQPMSDESSRYVLIYNGEIYNFKKIREDLKDSNLFFSQSDTEVILRLFQRDREQAWKELNGMFALAVFDSKTEELFLARDAAGIKPLYYYVDTEKFLFASEIKALLASGQIAEEIDPHAISLYLQFGYFPGDCTAYRGIKKLLPGCAAKITTRGMSIARYGKIETAQQQMIKEDAADMLDEILRLAVERQMVSDVPLGAFLSGGIDSSFLVAMMSRLSSAPIQTFTVGFPRMGYYDERPAAAEVAREFKTDHHEFAVEEGVAEVLPRIISAFDEPFADSSAIPALCLAKLARQYVTVALSGTGGDEMFGGYRKYMAARWATLYTALPGAVRSTVKKTTSLIPASRKTVWRERALLAQKFSQLSPSAQIDLQLNAVFSASESERLLGFPAATVDFTSSSRNLAEDLMLFDYQFYLPDDLLVKEDRCTMAFGLESRVPFLDQTVIEFMQSLPLKQKVSATATKILFKKVASRYLPLHVVRRPKHGFGAPAAEWLRTDLKELLLARVGTSKSYIRSSEIQKLISQHLRGAADHNKKLWTLLMLEMWYAK